MKGHPLNQSQRIVTIVGLGAALYVFGIWFTGLDSNLPYGWVAYAPLSNQFNVTGLHPWVRLIIWIVLIAVWALVSVWLLRVDSPT
jgi:hypothetical protein